MILNFTIYHIFIYLDIHLPKPTKHMNINAKKRWHADDGLQHADAPQPVNCASSSLSSESPPPPRASSSSSCNIGRDSSSSVLGMVTYLLTHSLTGPNCLCNTDPRQAQGEHPSRLLLLVLVPRILTPPFSAINENDFDCNYSFCYNLRTKRANVGVSFSTKIRDASPLF